MPHYCHSYSKWMCEINKNARPLKSHSLHHLFLHAATAAATASNFGWLIIIIALFPSELVYNIVFMWSVRNECYLRPLWQFYYCVQDHVLSWRNICGAILLKWFFGGGSDASGINKKITAGAINSAPFPIHYASASSRSPMSLCRNYSRKQSHWHRLRFAEHSDCFSTLIELRGAHNRGTVELKWRKAQRDEKNVLFV